MRNLSITAIMAATFIGITATPLYAEDLDAKCKQQQAINFWTSDCLEWSRQLNADLAEKRKLEEEARTAYWKNQREQEAIEKQEAERREAEKIKKDEAEGYKAITFEDFALDASKMEGAKVAIRGLYINNGERLIRDLRSAVRWVSDGESVKGGNIPLLTENASRNSRKIFLRCADTNSPFGCGMVIRGRVKVLKLSNRFGAQWREVGIVVESARQ